MPRPDAPLSHRCSPARSAGATATPLPSPTAALRPAPPEQRPRRGMVFLVGRNPRTRCPPVTSTSGVMAGAEIDAEARWLVYSGVRVAAGVDRFVLPLRRILPHSGQRSGVARRSYPQCGQHPAKRRRASDLRDHSHHAGSGIQGRSRSQCGKENNSSDSVLLAIAMWPKPSQFHRPVPTRHGLGTIARYSTRERGMRATRLSNSGRVRYVSRARVTDIRPRLLLTIATRTTRADDSTRATPRRSRVVKLRINKTTVAAKARRERAEATVKSL